MKKIVKKILRKPYRWALNIYDKCTADYAECSIGDILLKRGDLVLNNQLLLTSRLCDVEAYCEHGDETFPYQNAVSRKAYGAKHREKEGNRSFKKLIESYKAIGYKHDSIVTVDSDLVLMDGNHRMGLHIYEKIYKVNIRRVHRRPPYAYGIDWYYRVGLASGFMNELRSKYESIQQWLIDTGNTFSVYLPQCCLCLELNASFDMMGLCNVLNIKTIEAGGVSFSSLCQIPNIQL